MNNFAVFELLPVEKGRNKKISHYVNGLKHIGCYNVCRQNQPTLPLSR